MHHDWEKYEFSQKISVMCHAAILELRLSDFYSENNFCKVDVIFCQKVLIFTEILLCGYHVLCITQTWYFILDESAIGALFGTWQMHTFPQQCVILKIVFFLKNQSIMSVWYYHVCVIL